MLKITDGNFSKDADGVFAEIPLKLDAEDNKIRTRECGEFLIVDTDSGEQWGVTAQAVAELQRTTGRRLEIAVEQKASAASIVKPAVPEAVAQPKKFALERPSSRPSSSNEAIEAHNLEVENFDNARYAHAVASADYSRYEDRAIRCEEDTKTWADKIASTEEAHGKRQEEVDLEDAKVALILSRIKPDSHAKAVRGEALEESDLI